mgnify:CR=1 FL=1
MAPRSKARLGDLPEPGRLWTPAEVELIWDDPALLGQMLGKDWLISYTGDLHPKYTGLPVPPGLHSDWIKSVWLRNDPLMAHRGSLKTTDISEVGTIWNWTLPMGRRDDRVMLVRGTFTAAKSSMETIARNMKHPAVVSLFETLYGEGCTDTVYCRENEILYKFKRTNTKEGSITAWGILQDFTGFHCDRVLGDDFITRESQYSSAVRQKTISAVNEIQTNVVDKTGTCHWIGTPWHREDAWQCLRDPIKYAHRPRIDPKTGEQIHGTFLMSDAEYEDAIWGTRKDGKRYRKISRSQEAANYDLNPDVPDEGMLFADLASMAPWNPGLRPAPIVAHLDAAFDGDDWTALSFGQRLPDNRIQVTGFCWPEHVNLRIPEIVKLCKKYRVSKITAERNADKGFVLRDLAAAFKTQGMLVAIPKDAKGFPGYQESQNKHVKITTELLGAWPSLVWDTDVQEEYLSMVTSYNDHADHDDAPDSLASMVREFFPANVVQSSYAHLLAS